MKYLAHISPDEKREQTIKQHAEGTAERAAEFAKSFDHEDWGYCEGLLHDIGKYTKSFDERLHGAKIMVDHATAGAQLCSSLKGLYPYLSYCIAGHHAGLPDTGDKADTGSQKTLQGRLKKKIDDYQPYAEDIKIPDLTKPKIIINKDKTDFTVSFFIRMLFSCLVDADFLDTEYFMENGQVNRNPGASMDTLYEKLMSHICSWLENDDLTTVNGRRTEILKNCVLEGEKPRGYFRLTVPTGGGKTVASLAFALHHAVVNHLERVIYVIPYTSIIEQNAKVFSDILGAENVLENHCNVDYESSEEFRPMQLASENWDKPVVVTTNVQFFESLFSNKTSKCRKLHNIADSVIIFDEAQMLPVEYLKPCIAAMEELVTNYKSSIVLCTATQPALEKLFSSDIHFTELCPRMDEQFGFFKRVQFQNLGIITQEALSSRVREEAQALCILNTKRQVQNVYELLKGDGVYHLSTTMYPKHRKRMLKAIRERLKEGKRCIVIATSLVEAGVDLDFQTVYRQLAGVDSMIQAAGRCNREGERDKDRSVTYIFNFEDAARVPGQQLQIATAKQIMDKYVDVSSLDAIHEYFKRLYNYRGEALDKKGILEKFKKNKYPFAEVAGMFKLIEQKTVTVLIPFEEDALRIFGELKFKGPTRSLMREAGQYCINVYENDLEKFYSANLIREIDPNIEDGLWVLTNGEYYSEEMGLRLDVDYGMGVIC